MKNKKETIKKVVDIINNEEEQGGLWLPNIQRFFIWKEDQITKLLDSLLREYPIGNLLIWKTKEDVKIRKFIDNYNDGLFLSDYYVPKNNKTKLILLDGQQRLQSFYIALKGSYNKKELYFNVLSNKSENKQEDVIYEFKFLNKYEDNKPRGYILVKDIIYNNNEYDEIADQIAENINDSSPSEKSLIRKNVLKLIREFRDKENIAYTELDSVENVNLYDLNDVVEIFIRANSAGTPLNKSDLMFSLLSADWEDIDEDISIFIEEVNQQSFAMDRDFILKTSLILIGAGAKYDIKKFKNKQILSDLRKNWTNIKDSIKKVIDFIYDNTFIRDDRALPSYITIIPLIYFHYNYPDNFDDSNTKKKLAFWLIRILLAGAFSGSSDTLLDAVIKKIEEKKTFDIDTINNEIMNRGRSIKLTKESLLDTYYGQKKLYLIFSYWYQYINFKPAFQGNIPWTDHIFPQSILTVIKEPNPTTGYKIRKYGRQQRDQIANLMLLAAGENLEKRDKLPDEWLNGKNKEYYDMHLIPQNKELWKIEKYEKFIEERKKLILQKFEYLGLL